MEPALKQPLRNLSVSLASTDSINDALDLRLSAAVQLTQTEFGRNYLKNATGQSFKLYAHIGVNAENTHPVAQYAADSRYTHNLSAGCATLARDDNFDFSNLQKNLGRNSHTFLTLPLKHSGQLIDVLNLVSKTLPMITQDALEYAHWNGAAWSAPGIIENDDNDFYIKDIDKSIKITVC